MIARSQEIKIKNTVTSGLDSCAAVYGYRQVTQQLVAVFYEALKDLSPDCIEWAFAEWLRTGQRFPTPAAIRDLAAGHVSDEIEEDQRLRSRHARDDQRVEADPAVILGLQRYRDAVRKILQPLHTETDVLARQIGLCELGRGSTAQLQWIRKAGDRIDFYDYSPQYRQQCAQIILTEEHEMSLLRAADFIAVARLDLQREARRTA